MAKFLHMSIDTNTYKAISFIKTNIMASIEFGGSAKNNRKHQCYSEQEGEWIVFRCHLCPDYERRMHLKTGKMKSKGHNDDSDILHNGFYIRPGLDYRPN